MQRGDEHLVKAKRLKERENARLKRLLAGAELDKATLRPSGRPPTEPAVRYGDFMYRAGSWDRGRCVVAKVEWHQGELFVAILECIQRFGVPSPLAQRGLRGDRMEN